MDKTRADAEANLRHQLEQVALELETASAAARNAAKKFEEPARAWVEVQQLLTRFEEATHLMAEFRRSVDHLIQTSGPGDAARIAATSRNPVKD